MANLKVLLDNIGVNLLDTTIFTSLPALSDVVALAEFELLPLATGYVVLTADADPDAVTSLLVHLNPIVSVHYVSASKMTPTMKTAIKTSITDMENIKNALCRPDPYGEGKPSASYVAMTNQGFVNLVGYEYPRVEQKYFEDDDEGEGDRRIVQTIHIQYGLAVPRKT